MTDPMWMVHAACGHCPIPHGGHPPGQRCHYACHPGVDCAPVHAVETSAKPPSPAAGYQARCSSCGRPVEGAFRSHKCQTGGAAS